MRIRVQLEVVESPEKLALLERQAAALEDVAALLRTLTGVGANTDKLRTAREALAATVAAHPAPSDK